MPRILLDTHAVLWWLQDDPALSRGARAAIGEPRTIAHVSVASVWEAAIKVERGKLAAPAGLPGEISRRGLRWLQITPEYAWAARDLPHLHGDPFDRLLVAQALAEDLPVVTADPVFARYGVDVLW